MAPGVDRADREAAGLDLLARYDEPHRAHHDRRHLADVIAAVALLAEHAVDLSAVMLAAWWHDAVYEIGSPDNERASADLAVATLAGWDVEPDRARRVADLIRMTAGHDPAPGDDDGEVLSDSDLAILASPPTRYTRYAADVRHEYRAVPEAVFAAGRAELLRELLARPRIYRTRSAHDRWEEPARDNLTAELRRLL
jgi:predicted metal-dependent HD superfamily phosphohydrolase